jgi:hypothetical protein
MQITSLKDGLEMGDPGKALTQAYRPRPPKIFRWECQVKLGWGLYLVPTTHYDVGDKVPVS